MKTPKAIFEGGLDSFEMKVIALIFMTLDHIGYFLDGILHIPLLFSILGRMSAPMFLFILANGFRYTHDRIKYMKRMYIASVLMNLGNILANRFFRHPLGASVFNDIFGTMFLVLFFLYMIERLRKAWSDKDGRKVVSSVIFIMIPLLIGAASLRILSSEDAGGGTNTLLNAAQSAVSWISVFLPSPITVEGSVWWVVLGVCFFYLLDHKRLLAVFYILFSAAAFAFQTLPEGLSLSNILQYNQWFMVFALVFFLLYNGKRGRPVKTFFYVYYPAHIYGLLALSHLLFAVCGAGHA